MKDGENLKIKNGNEPACADGGGCEAAELADMLCCPVCRAPLEREGGSLFCRGEGKRHCYDIASSGYVNLLPPGKGKNSRTGDEKRMIDARSAFLDTGLYDPISARLGEIIAEISLSEGARRVFVIDAGCGEGYHTCMAVKRAADLGVSSAVIGFDASKHGVSKGAKRARLMNVFSGAVRSRAAKETDGGQREQGAGTSQILFAAGNIFRLPVRDAFADFCISMFAPIAGEEMLRVLRPGGRLIVLSSGERHLYELRELLYDAPRLSGGQVRIPDGFVKETEERLVYKFTAENNAVLQNLFTMTPFYYKTSPADRAKLDAAEKLTVTADVKYTVCLRRSLPPAAKTF